MTVNILTKESISKLLFCLALSLCFTTANANNFEALSDIRITAELFALAQIDNAELSSIEAHAVTMDSRLQLEKCEQPLEAFATSNSRNIARTTVGVRCTGIKPWTLYVPVSISAMAEVVYTTRPLIRGEIVQNGDVEIRQVALNVLPTNYLSNIDQLAGMELTQSVRSGIALTLNTIKTRQIVQRGQEVVILAKAGGVEVRMTGIALSNGSSGDLISIRNIRSGRTIEAMVLDGSTVTVNM